MKNKTYAYDSLGERIKTEWIIYLLWNIIDKMIRCVA